MIKMGNSVKDFKKGIYRPLNPQKFKGKKVPVYRSSYELKFMRFLDVSDNVIEWSSEAIAISYYNPLKAQYCRYYPDFIVKYVDKTGQEHIEVIEIKPKKQTKEPTNHGNKKKSTLLTETRIWQINKAKWEAAKEFCDKRGIGFKILTEKDLNI
jgi:hypothetical protein